MIDLLIECKQISETIKKSIFSIRKELNCDTIFLLGDLVFGNNGFCFFWIIRAIFGVTNLLEGYFLKAMGLRVVDKEAFEVGLGEGDYSWIELRFHINAI